ncbi:MAG TPA: hypothetical protein PLP19_15880 [bacterium]|nr:hypothetical protein [bacterium]HPN44971.1 hypothetical protein [bacterium]
MKTQSPDTHPQAEEKLIELIRKQTPAQKMAQISSLTFTAMRLSKRAIARANKDLDEQEVNLLFIEYHYGKDLAERVRKYLQRKRDGNK